MLNVSCRPALNPAIRALRAAARRIWRITCAIAAAALTLTAPAQEGYLGRPDLTIAAPVDRPLRLPSAVAVRADGQVFVADGVNDRVVEFDASGELARELREANGVPLHDPVGLAVDARGHLWVCDTANRRLVEFDPVGNFVRQIAAPALGGERPVDLTDVAPTPDGAVVWLADNDNHRLLRLELASGAWHVLGQRGSALGQFQYPFRLALAPNGDLLVSDVINARAQLYSAQGQALNSVGQFGIELGTLFRPSGVAVDSAGQLWIADSVTGAIQVFRPNGSWDELLRDESGAALRFAAPLGLAFDSVGRLYVLEQRAGRVQRVVIERVRATVPPPPRRAARSATGRQAQACAVCHIEWLPPFSTGADSPLMPRPATSADDPFVAHSDMCLSCHDGSVADSRHRVWLEHGHRTGIVPPPTMTVPSNLPLVDGRVACRTCHSAHGNPGAAEGDIAKAVLLRVENVASELCMSCHADKTRGPRFGTHPTGGMPWPIPEPLIQAGAKVGPDPRELTCQVCHTPHGAAYDHLLVMGTDSNQLCRTCHEQMRPGMFVEHGEREHPLSPIASAEQAAAVSAMNTRLGPNNELICLSCHKLHEGHGQRFMLAAELKDGEFCLACHRGRTEMLDSPHDLRTNFPQERNRLGMTVADGGPCSACHLFHRFARASTPTDADPVGHCATCHAPDQCASKKALGDANHPHAHCIDCHNPHVTQFGHFLPAPAEQVCGRCHTEQAQLAGGAHDVCEGGDRWPAATTHTADRCLACHRPHGTQSEGLFRGGLAVGEHGTDAACVACHSDTGFFASGPKAALHPRGEAGGTNGADLGGAGCAQCHDPHSRAPKGQWLLAGAGDLSTGQPCLSCHGDQHAILASGHAPYHFVAAGLSAGSCKPCHNVHGDPQSRAAHLWAADLRGTPESVNEDAECVVCHRIDGAAPAPRIATHPEVLPMEIAASSLPLYGADGTPDPAGVIRCRTCHLPHGRAQDADTIQALLGLPPVARSALQLLLRPFETPNACTTCHGFDGLRRYQYFHNPDRRGGPIE